MPRRSGRASAGIGHGPPRWSARIGGVDASIAVQWFANEPGSERAARLIVEERPLLAPDLMPVEAANTWWKKVRQHEMDATDLDQAIVNLLALGIAFYPSAALLSRAARLALEVDHPVYDCLYLALAINENCRLVTADQATVNQLATHFPFIVPLVSLPA